MNLNTLKDISYCGSNVGYTEAVREEVVEHDPSLTPKQVNEKTTAVLEKATLFNSFNKEVVPSNNSAMVRNKRNKRRIKNGKRKIRR